MNIYLSIAGSVVALLVIFTFKDQPTPDKSKLVKKEDSSGPLISQTSVELPKESLVDADQFENKSDENLQVQVNTPNASK